jgi:hypothetical protein
LATRNAFSVSLSLHDPQRSQDFDQSSQKDVFRGDQKVRDFSASLAMGLASELSDDAISRVLGGPAVKAFRYAHDKLHGFVRKTTGEPAFCHSADIALRAKDLGYPDRVIQGSLLHDTVEDRSKNLDQIIECSEDLRRHFDPEVVRDVLCSTNIYSVIIRALETRLSKNLPFDETSAKLMRHELNAYRTTLSPNTQHRFKSEFEQLLDYFLVEIDLSGGARKARIDVKYTVVSELRLQSYKLFVQDIHDDARFRQGASGQNFHDEALIIKTLDLIDNLRTSEVANFGSLERILLKAETFLDCTFFLHDYIRTFPNNHSSFIQLYDYLKCHLVEQLLERSRALVFLSDTRFGFLSGFLLREVERLQGKYKVQGSPIETLNKIRQDLREFHLSVDLKNQV